MKKHIRLISLVLSLILTVPVLFSCAHDANENSENGESTAADPSAVSAEASEESSDETSEENSEEDMEKYFDDESFVPVLRFSVASDVHIGDYDSKVREDRLAKMFEVAYGYADNSKTPYKALDAALFAGDLSDGGTKSAQIKFRTVMEKSIREGTTPLLVAGNHDFYNDKNTALAQFCEVFACEANTHAVINGFHFICMSPSDGDHFDSSVQNWLKEQLEEAAADDPTKPIFVMQHQHVYNTVYGSITWGVNDLTSILSKYPQVVDFSGHSHFPLKDPRIIWQGTFTAVGTGTLNYYEIGINGYRDDCLFPADHQGGWSAAITGDCTAAEFHIVEVDETGAVRIISYDLLSDTELCRRYIRTPSDPSTFTYKPAERKKDSEKPYFAEGASLEITDVTHNSFKVTIPQASSKDVVESYRVVVSHDGKNEQTVYVLSDYFFVPMPEKVRGNVYKLAENTEYDVKVYAVNAYNVVSDEYLEAKVTTKEKASVVSDAPVPDIFESVIDENGVTDGVSGASLVKSASMTAPVFDAELGGYVIKCGGNGDYGYKDFGKLYGKMQSSVTLEAYCKLDSFTSPYSDIFGNMQSGGCGFEVLPDGTLQFYISINGSYHTPSAAIPKGEFVHLVGTYDGEYVRLYVDGTLAAEEHAPGRITWTTVQAAQYLSLGADSDSYGGPEYPITGILAHAAVYSKAVTDGEAEALYEKAISNK